MKYLVITLLLFTLSNADKTELNNEIFNNIKINKILKINDTVSELIKNITNAEKISKGKFEKTKDFEIRKKKIKSQMSLDKIYATNIDPRRLRYDPDKEVWQISIGEFSDKYGSIYNSIKKANYRIYSRYDVSQSTSIGTNGYGVKVEITKYTTQGQGLLILDSNIVDLFNKSTDILIPMSIKQAQKLENKIKVKILYQLNNLNVIEEGFYSEATFDYPTEYFTIKEFLDINPIGVVIYYDNKILKKFSIYDISKL